MVILSHKKNRKSIYGALTDNYEKVFFVFDALNSLWGKLVFRELFYTEFPNNFAHYITVLVKCVIFLRITTSLLLIL